MKNLTRESLVLVLIVRSWGVGKEGAQKQQRQGGKCHDGNLQLKIYGTWGRRRNPIVTLGTIPQQNYSLPIDLIKNVGRSPVKSQFVLAD